MNLKLYNNDFDVVVKKEMTIEQAKEHLKLKKDIDAFYTNRIWNVFTFYFGTIVVSMTILMILLFVLLVIIKAYNTL
jgi:hypothetical protein